MQPVRVPELIGVRFDGMGRAVGQAAAAPVLREQGFARVFGAAEAGEEVEPDLTKAEASKRIDELRHKTVKETSGR